MAPVKAARAGSSLASSSASQQSRAREQAPEGADPSLKLLAAGSVLDGSSHETDGVGGVVVSIPLTVNDESRKVYALNDSQATSDCTLRGLSRTGRAGTVSRSGRLAP